MSFQGTVNYEAGPRVNVVEGPNGSGKSSLMTAICVGLAGSMKNLGRQKSIGQLIRRGCAAFEVEIVLSGGPGHPDYVVFRRTGRSLSNSRKRRRAGPTEGTAAADEDDENDEDDADPGQSSSVHTEWRLNGRVVPEARVKELTREMTIHFSNLCQFLPQERVGEFSSLGPVQLLESTEETIGNGELLVQHRELIRRSGELNLKREELKRSLERLQRVQAEQEANRNDYERLQRRNDLRKQVKLIELKLLWVAKQLAAAKVEAARAVEDGEVQKLEAARRELADAQRPCQARSLAVEAAKRTVTRLKHQAQSQEDVISQGLVALRQQEEACKRREDAFIGLRTKARKWEQDVDRCHNDLQQARQEREGLPTALPPDRAARRDRITQELQQLSLESGDVEHLLRQQRARMEDTNRDIRRLEGVMRQHRDRLQQRLRKLERECPGSTELYNWIQQTREAGGFRRRVLGPVLMEISPIMDPYWAACAEKAIGVKYLGAVVVEDTADNDEVHNWLQQQRDRARRADWRSRAFNNCVLCKEVQQAVRYPHGEARQYARYGISHTVDQLFEASSELIKVALVDVATINQAYVGTRETDGMMMELLRRTPVRKVFIPGKLVTQSTSMYDSSYVSQGIENLDPAKLLSDNALVGDEQGDQQQLDERLRAKAQLQTEIGALEGRLHELEAAQGRLSNDRHAIAAEFKAIELRLEESARRITDLERRLRNLNQRGNPEGEAAGLRDALKRDSELLVQKAREMVHVFEHLHKLHRQLAEAELALAAASAGMAPLQQAVRRAEAVVRDAEAGLARAKQEVGRAQERLGRAEARLGEELGGRGPTAEMLAAWQQWSNEASELEQLLADKQAEMEQAQSALRGDEKALLEAWQRREAEIRELRSSTAAGTSQVEAAAADLQARKEAWLPTLKRHMDTINESVKSHFAAIGCAGEVILREEGDAYEQYAAEIRVRHRPTEPLRALSRHHHSGGERSVATMLYLMALQGVTTTPFRIVDEINQGMDSRNERKVFNLLVECSSRPDTPQCFLLTPKLIANLQYSENVRVLTLKYAVSGSAITPQAALARVQAAAEREAADGEGEGGEEGERTGRDQRRVRQHEAGVAAALTLGEFPWNVKRMKMTLLLGRSHAAGRT